MDPVARDVCMAVGNDQIADPYGVAKISQVPNDYFAPDAVDSISEDAVRISDLEQTALTMDKYVVRIDLPRRGAESLM